jgi:dTDP-4-dehydrorhamnose reductase
MKRVLLLGVSGMLGSEVYKVLCHRYEVVATTRRDFNVERIMDDPFYFSNFVNRIGKVDYVINCIGVTIPNSKKNPGVTFFVNSTFPHILAREYGDKLIHITTDCVYSGIDGGAPYNESSRISPKDIYGLSKSLGEPRNCLTIRTSIIGTGGDGKGLLDWFLKQKGTVHGYTDHMWNGITTHQFGLVCDKIMSNMLCPKPTGMMHVFGSSISKFDMLAAFKRTFNVECEIVPTAGNPVDRRLSTNSALLGWLNNDWLEIPTFHEMLENATQLAVAS